MTQHPALTSLIASCTLLAMKGIVPSLLALQQRLQQQVTDYGLYLNAQDYPSNEIEALQRLICRVIDGLAHKNCTSQNMSWRDHQLTPLLFGYHHDAPLNAAAYGLLNSTVHAEIRQAAQLFCALLPQPLPSEAHHMMLPISLPAVVTSEAVMDSEPAPMYAADPGRQINWLSLGCQIFGASLLLAFVWFCCHSLLHGAW